MSRTYLRGDLYYADLGHGIGSEQKGTRPVVIIQNNVGNKCRMEGPKLCQPGFFASTIRTPCRSSS